jgi:peptidoglycan hydrolase CwlO-like protein
VKRAKLQAMSVDELVERFVAISLDQDKSLLENETAEYNRLYDEMEAVEAELKERTGDQRRALLPLYEHSNAQVRLKAAIATLPVDAKAARAVLQKISDEQEYPEAAYARSMMRALDEGTYKPN